jgi:nucleotide-binding universal stress UspA family protein
MFKRILAAIDGSEHSTKAAEVAIELARTYGSDLTLLHVTRKLDLPDQLKEYLSRSI